MATRAAPRKRAVRPPKAKWYEHGPFLGVRDEWFMDDEDDKYLAAALQAYHHPGEFPRLGLRPGFVPTPAAAASTVGQWVGQYTWTDAGGAVQETTMQFLAGIPYIFNWTTNAWSGPGLGAVVVSTTALMIHAHPFSNKLVFNDGVNPPFFYNGVTGTFTAITLKAGGVAADQVAYGRPAVKDAKLIFIRKNDRTRIVWSETDDPTLGYEQASYANFHSLTQTSSDPLYAIHGTNDGLYFFRSHSIGVRRGQINTEYSTAATNDEVSTTVGTKSPGSVCAVDLEGVASSIWFLDTRARPHRLVPGLGVTDLGRACSSKARRSNLSLAERFWGVYNPSTGVVVFNIADVAWPGRFPAFGARTSAYLGEWYYLNSVASPAAGLVRRASPKGVGQPSMALFVQPAASALVAWQRDESDTFMAVGYSDLALDNTTPMTLDVQTAHFGAGEVGEKQFDWLECVAHEVDIAGITVEWFSSNGGVGAAVVPDGSFAGSGVTQSFQAGVLVAARWLVVVVKITPTVSTRRPAVERIRVRAVPTGDPPGTG